MCVCFVVFLFFSFLFFLFSRVRETERMLQHPSGEVEGGGPLSLSLVRVGVGLRQAQVLRQDVRGQRPAVAKRIRPRGTYVENGFFDRRVVVVLGRAVRLGAAVAVTGTARVRAGRAEQARRKSGIPRR